MIVEGKEASRRGVGCREGGSTRGGTARGEVEEEEAAMAEARGEGALGRISNLPTPWPTSNSSKGISISLGARLRAAREKSMRHTSDAAVSNVSAMINVLTTVLRNEKG